MKKDSKKYTEIHTTALKQFDQIQSAVYDERMQCLADRRFYSIAGAQWEDSLGEQFENKPKLEINKIHLSVIRIINEYRNNKISVNFTSKDGSKNENLAETCNGLYRADEQDSCADEAYDNAFEEGVGGGMGAWRLRADYEDEEDEDSDYQRVYIEPIYDADSTVFFDLNAKRQDKSDANFCFVLTSMTREAYEDEYGLFPSEVNKDIEQTQFDWSSPDLVYIAEYYKKVTIKKNILIFETIEGDEVRYSEDEIENDENLLPMLNAIGTKQVGMKTVKKKKIRKYIISGDGVLEDLGIIAGCNIPIVPYYGKRWYVDGVERCMGHVRLCKDSQRLKNMQTSKLAEISALSSIEKPILTPKQVAGHETRWSKDNIKNYPYLLVNEIEDMIGNPVIIGPTSYSRSPQIPPAMAALLQLTDNDMKEILGNQQGGEEILANTSGKAVELIQTRLDMQSFIYISNMSKAIKRSGEIWLSMARDIFVESGRKMKIIGSSDDISQVELSKPVLDEKTGEVIQENDLSRAKFDVAVNVGPSSQSKKSATVRSIMEMMQVNQDPATMQVLSAMAMMNMEGEGISETREFFRNKLLHMGAVKPTKEESEELIQELQNEEPDANQQYLMAAAQAAEADAAKSRADTSLTIAKTEETRAKTAETLAGINREDFEQAINLAKDINESTLKGEQEKDDDYED